MTNSMKSKIKKNRLTALIFIVITVVGLISFYNLISLGKIGFLIFLGEIIGFIILIVLWNSCTYGYLCRVCGYEFNIGFIKKLTMKTEEIKCPRCYQKDIIKENFLDNSIDIDED